MLKSYTYKVESVADTSITVSVTGEGKEAETVKIPLAGKNYDTGAESEIVLTNVRFEIEKYIKAYYTGKDLEAKPAKSDTVATLEGKSFTMSTN